MADFGLSRILNPSKNLYTNRVVTLWYRAPELILGEKNYTGKIDIWSIGCLFAELLTLEPLFPGDNETKQLELILKMCGMPTEKTWPGISKYPFLEKFEMKHYKFQLTEYMKQFP